MSDKRQGRNVLFAASEVEHEMLECLSRPDIGHFACRDEKTYYYDPTSNTIRMSISISPQDCPADVIHELLAMQSRHTVDLSEYLVAKSMMKQDKAGYAL